jgi:hypothetical protein
MMQFNLVNIKQRLGYFLSLVALMIFSQSCEDKIDVDIQNGDPQLVVDGWLNNFGGNQRIRLSLSQPYFDNGAIPQLTGAIIRVVNEDTEQVFEFIDQENGNYIYTQAPGERIVQQGFNYRLEVEWAGMTFEAFARANRTTVVDSITYEFEEISTFNQTEGYSAQLHATDSVGAPDFYWVKTFKNGSMLVRPNLINNVYDAAGGPGSDGFPFIPPIRFRATDSNDLYQVGDSIRVEIHSIDRAAFFFLDQARNQLSNGGLFATPPENIRSNIRNTDANSMAPLGWFGVSIVETLAGVIENVESGTILPD